jgi:hypothetical protein
LMSAQPVAHCTAEVLLRRWVIASSTDMPQLPWREREVDHVRAACGRGLLSCGRGLLLSCGRGIVLSCARVCGRARESIQTAARRECHSKLLVCHSKLLSLQAIGVPQQAIVTASYWSHLSIC